MSTKYSSQVADTLAGAIKSDARSSTRNTGVKYYYYIRDTPFSPKAKRVVKKFHGTIILYHLFFSDFSRA